MTILAATDLSLQGDRAVERAVEIARRRNTGLVVLHVMAERLEEREAKAKAAKAEEAIRDHIAALGVNGGVVVEAFVGIPEDDIIERAQALGADLVVLGPHGRGRTSDIVFGTTARRVASRCPVPVLVATNRADHPYREIVLGMDFSAFARTGLEEAIRLFPEARFHLVQAHDLPFGGFLSGGRTAKEIEAQHRQAFDQAIAGEIAHLRQIATGPLPEIDSELRRDMPWQALAGKVAEIKADLLVIGTHGRTAMSETVFGSVARHMLENPPCDILVVHRKVL